MGEHGDSVVVFNHVGRLAPRVRQELRTLSDVGADVTVFHWGRGESTAGGGDPWTDHRLDTDAPVGWLGAMLYLPWLYARLLAVAWRRDADVVHLTHLMFLPLAPVLAYGVGLSVVYDSYEFHALDLSLRFPAPVRPLVEGTVRVVEDTLVRTVDCVLTIDSVGGHLARRYRRVCHNVAVLYNVPAVAGSDGPPEGVSDRDDGDGYRLVYVGGISVEKGALRAVETARVLREAGYPVTLQFVGTIHGDESWFHEAVRDAGVADAVTHTAWLPYEEMLARIADADVALALHQPTERFRRVSTGNGRKFFTYMEAGLPVVGPAFGEVGDAVSAAECGRLVDTTDTAAVAGAVGDFLDDPELRAELGASGRRAVESRFNWGAERRKLITAYEQVTNIE
ncbi:glycosyltransferase [Halorientalis litorea]|uniref:glycosyltransferase n=1 Tax=Halorientalis litorea TaxID=2931977 RepID=UPI001FF36AB0|nr:glycosyltransferase [Halorientalis litorea]